MKEYYRITKQEFETGLKKICQPLIFGNRKLITSIKQINERNVKEYVYELITFNENISIKIYSSIDIFKGQTRDSGEDAIRCILVYKNKNIFISKTHTKRLKNWEVNLGTKINELLNKIKDIPECPSCKELMVQRKGKYQLFWGCSNYPNCNHTLKL